VDALTLSHFTNAQTIELRSVSQGTGMKPRGLWVSADGEDDWPTWCKAEGYRLDRLVNRFVVTLSDEANILHLTTVREVLEFSNEYMDQNEPEWLRGWRIDWPKLAEKYQGIIIAPYQWALRSDDRTRWYWGWDVASGCIWDASAIQSVTR